MELTSQQGKINTGEGNNMIEPIKIRGLKQNDLKNIRYMLVVSMDVALEDRLQKIQDEGGNKNG